MNVRITAACILTLIVGTVFFWPWMSGVELFSTGRDQVRMCARMADGEEMILSFTHSVNKRPVYETLRVQDGSLVIVKSRFDAFGAGMPETSTSEGTFTVLRDGWLEWTVNRAVPEIVVRVGRVAGHRLRIRGQEIDLADLTEPGDGLRIRSERFSIYRMMKGGCLW
ncbi:MAG: DUF1850 domain-containing protein [Syntrophobacteraceae bacterium]